MLKINIKQNDPDLLYFKKHVLLGYCDVSSAGSRALMGINMRVEYYDLCICEMRHVHSACVRTGSLDPKEEDFIPLQVLNCKYEQYTLVIVNTILSGKLVHYVTERIMQLCAESKSETLLILSSLNLDIPVYKDNLIFENCFNHGKNITDHKSLPGNTLVCDPFLCTLLQMAEIENIPTNILITPGYKALNGNANCDDRSKQSIVLFHKELERITGLRFDTDFSLSLVYKPDTEAADTHLSIYM